MPLTSDEALNLLQNAYSPQRRRGAKRLRTLADPGTADAMRHTLTTEVLDHRTWETQYQLVLALGATGTDEDLTLLQDLVHRPRDPSMVNCALGYAIVQLAWVHRRDPEVIAWCYERRLTPTTPALEVLYEVNGLDAWVPLLDEGTDGAVVDLRIVPPQSLMAAMLDRAVGMLDNPGRPRDLLGLNVVKAAAMWQGREFQKFLERYQEDPREELATAARQSLAGRPSRSHF